MPGNGNPAERVAHGRGLYPRREGGLVTMEETQFHVDWVKGVTVWLRYG